MIIADLSLAQLNTALRSEGVTLRIGLFDVRIQSTLPSIVEGIHNLYADYPVSLDAEFTDFQVKLFKPRGIRRWLKPQVLFSNDDYIPFKPLPYNQAFAFLEWGLNWCFAQFIHNYLILHAAVIEKDGKAVILPAPPGSGKSTLCAALVCNGWRLLSDEMAMIDLNTGLIAAVPRPVSLKNDSINIMRKFAENSVISAPTYDTNKGTVAHMKAPASSVAKAKTLATPVWIITPRYTPNAKPSLVKQSKAKSFMMGVTNSFNYSVLGVKGFHVLGDLVEKCDTYEFFYSALEDGIEIFSTLNSHDLALDDSV